MKGFSVEDPHIQLSVMGTFLNKVTQQGGNVGDMPTLMTLVIAGKKCFKKMS